MRGRKRVGLALLETAGRLIPDAALDLQAQRHRRRAMPLATIGLRGVARALQVRGQADSEMVVLRLAEQIYRRARDRSTLATALTRRAGPQRAAELEAMRRGAPPREWAAFTTVGDPLVTVPLQVPSRAPSRRVAALAALALGAGAAGTYALRARRRRV